MSDKCPKCGAAMRIMAEPASCNVIGQHRIGGELCLERQLAEARSWLTVAANRLDGYEPQSANQDLRDAAKENT